MSGFDKLRKAIRQQDGRVGIVQVGDVDFGGSRTTKSKSAERQTEHKPISPKSRGTLKTMAAGSPVYLEQELGKRSKVPVVPSIRPDEPEGSSSERLLHKAIDGEYTYAKLGLILGLASIIGGVLLGLNGVAGSTSWTAKFLGLESQVNDAAPGVVLFIVGIFMIFLTKPRVKIGDLRD